MQFEVTEINENEGTVSGIVRSDGRDLTDTAHEFMRSPHNNCPYNGGSGDMCPVESWICKGPDDAPGARAGDWMLTFRIRDPAILVGIGEGTHRVQIEKNPLGWLAGAVLNHGIGTALNSAANFLDDNAEKSMEDNNMSNANEIFNQLVEDRMAEMRSARSDLTEEELREKAAAEILEAHPEFSPDRVEKEVREFNRLVDERINAIRKSAAAPRDAGVLKAIATAEISKERPDLARAILRRERAESTMPPAPIVIKSATQTQTPMGPAAREMDRLVQSRMGTIRKSAGARDEKIIKSMAVAAITRENPELTRAVITEERQAAARLAYGGMV